MAGDEFLMGRRLERLYPAELWGAWILGRASGGVTRSCFTLGISGANLWAKRIHLPGRSLSDHFLREKAATCSGIQPHSRGCRGRNLVSRIASRGVCAWGSWKGVAWRVARCTICLAFILRFLVAFFESLGLTRLPPAETPIRDPLCWGSPGWPCAANRPTCACVRMPPRSAAAGVAFWVAFGLTAAVA